MVIVDYDPRNVGRIGDVRNRYHRDGHLLFERGINENHALDLAVHQRVRGILNLLGRKAMAFYKVVEFCLCQFRLNAADQHGRKLVANLRHQDRHAERSLGVQVAGEEVGTILKFVHRLPNTVLCPFCDCAGQRRIGENN